MSIDRKAFDATYKVMCQRMNGDEASIRREIKLCLETYEAAKSADQPSSGYTSAEHGHENLVVGTRQPVGISHQLYKDGDALAPASIKDGNGEIVLGLCKICGKGEAELAQPCIQHVDCRAAFEEWYYGEFGIKPGVFGFGTYHNRTVQGRWQAWKAASKPKRESFDVDLRLIDDAITKMTKAATNLVNGEGFTSSFEEDHRPTTPKWVIGCFMQDDAKRVWLGQEIAQGINWVRNATAKLREAKRNDIEGG